MDQPLNHYDLTRAVWQIANSMCKLVDDVRHIDMTTVACSYTVCRSDSDDGVLATMTPCRFENGLLSGILDGRRVKTQQVFDADGREILYIFTVFIPRFLNLTIREKLITISHELWHIGPKCNGELRRFAGRCHIHGDEKLFDQQAEWIVDQWLENPGVNKIEAFLHHDFEELSNRYDRIVGQKIQQPKIIDVT